MTISDAPDHVPPASIWVVEDDASIGTGLVRALEVQGHHVELARSLAEARALEGVPDLVLLDLGLPDGDGTELCPEIVERFPNVRIIMVTARDSELEIVVGLNSGAIDYLAKPFRLAELLARIRAQLRSKPYGNSEPLQSVALGDLLIDRRARRVWVDGVESDLRAKEFELLVRLADEPGAVVRREDLMSDVWDEHWFGSTKTLDVHICSLRRHLGESASDASRITTIRGVGYRLES